MPGWTSPQLGGLLHLQRSHGENSPQRSGLPGPADRATRSVGYPTSHVNAIKNKAEIVIAYLRGTQRLISVDFCPKSLNRLRNSDEDPKSPFEIISATSKIS